MPSTQLSQLEINLALALREIEDLKKQREEDSQKIDGLESWKETCTKWGAWWAGVCATVMTLATLVRTYWSDIAIFFKGLK